MTKVPLTESEYVEQLRTLGESLHFHDDVWWQSVSPLYCKPAFEYRRLAVNQARPDRLRALLGYSHMVDTEASANSAKQMIAMAREAIAGFSMTSLDGAERAQVRKGLRLLQIAPIVDLEVVLEDLRILNVSQARRTQHGLPAEYYEENADAWRRYMRRLFALPNRTWLGAFADDRLVAFYYYYQVEDVLMIDSAKSHADHLKKCPNSALVYTILDQARRTGDVRLIVYGGPSRNQNLDNFKARYGFRATSLPVRSHLTAPGKLARQVLMRSAGASALLERMAVGSSDR